MACIHTTEALAANPPDSVSVRLARLNHGQGHPEVSAGTPAATPANSLPPDVISQLGPAANGVVLAQVVCVLKVVGPRGRSVCKTLRRLTALDGAVGLDAGTLILQLTAVAQQPPAVAATAVLLAGFEGLQEEGSVSMQLAAVEAAFSPSIPQLSSKCIDYLSQARVRLAALPSCPLVQPGTPPGYLHNSSWERRRLQQQRQLRKVGRGADATASSSGGEVRLGDAAGADRWGAMSPSAHTCWRLLQQAEESWFAAAAAANADWFNSSRSWESGSSASAQQHDMQQGDQVVMAGTEAAAAHAAAHPAPSPALLAGCVGYDASSEWGGTWVSAAEFMRPGGGCDKQSINELPRSAPLVLTQPRNACGSYLENAAMIRGAIAVVLRGNCGFIDKAMAADAAGAVGVVVLNTQGSRELVTMSGDESGRSPDIPAVLVGGDDAMKLLWWLERQPMVGALTAYNPVELQQQQLQQEKEKEGKQGSGQQEQKEAGSKQKAGPDKGGGAAASTAAGGAMLTTTAGAVHPATHALVQTKVDLLIPGRTYKWLQDNVVKAGGDLNAVYAAVLRDSRVMAALQGVMNGRRGQP